MGDNPIAAPVPNPIPVTDGSPADSFASTFMGSVNNLAQTAQETVKNAFGFLSADTVKATNDAVNGWLTSGAKEITNSVVNTSLAATVAASVRGIGSDMLPEIQKQQQQAYTTTLATGQAQAAVSAHDAQAAANTRDSIAQTAGQLGLTQGSPDRASLLSDLNNSVAAVQQIQQRKNEILNKDFLSDPGGWIVDRVVNLPFVQDKLTNAVQAVQDIHGAVDAKVDALVKLGSVDAAVLSKDDQARVALINKLGLAKALQDATEAERPYLQNKQAAYNMQTEQASVAGNLAVGIARTQVERGSAEGKLAADFNTAAYYGVAKTMGAIDLIAKADNLFTNAIKNAGSFADSQALNASLTDVLKFNGFLKGNETFDIMKQTYSPQQRIALTSAVQSLARTGSLGSTPAEVIHNVERSGNILSSRFTDATRLGYNRLSAQYVQILAQAQEKNAMGVVDADHPGLKGAEAQQYADVKFNQLVATKANEPSGANNGVYDEVKMGTLLTSLTLKDNLVAQRMIPQAIDTNGQLKNTPMDWTNATQVAAKLIQEKKYTEVQAAQALKDMAIESINQSQSAIGAKFMAVPLPEKYKKVINIHGDSGGSSGLQVPDMNSISSILSVLHKTMEYNDLKATVKGAAFLGAGGSAARSLRSIFDNSSNLFRGN